MLLVESESDLNKLLNKVSEKGKQWSMEININRTKCMLVTNKNHNNIKVYIGQEKIEPTLRFQYLGNYIDENMNNSTDTKCDIAKAKQRFWQCKELFRNNITLKLKKKLIHSFVFLIMRYSSECFILTEKIKKSYSLWDVVLQTNIEDKLASFEDKWRNSKSNANEYTAIAEQDS